MRTKKPKRERPVAGHTLESIIDGMELDDVRAALLLHPSAKLFDLHRVSASLLRAALLVSVKIGRIPAEALKPKEKK